MCVCGGGGGGGGKNERIFGLLLRIDVTLKQIFYQGFQPPSTVCCYGLLGYYHSRSVWIGALLCFLFDSKI